MKTKFTAIASALLVAGSMSACQGIIDSVEDAAQEQARNLAAKALANPTVMKNLIGPAMDKVAEGDGAAAPGFQPAAVVTEKPLGRTKEFNKNGASGTLIVTDDSYFKVTTDAEDGIDRKAMHIDATLKDVKVDKVNGDIQGKLLFDGEIQKNAETGDVSCVPAPSLSGGFDIYNKTAFGDKPVELDFNGTFECIDAGSVKAKLTINGDSIEFTMDGKEKFLEVKPLD